MQVGAPSPGKKGHRTLISPIGRKIDAYVFVRSYQETEKQRHKSVAKGLERSDPHWKNRELIVFPSHVSGSENDIDEMVGLAHAAGFDTVCAAILLDTDTRSQLASIWGKNWDERWALPNPGQKDADVRSSQLRALGCDLWTWISRGLGL